MFFITTEPAAAIEYWPIVVLWFTAHPIAKLAPSRLTKWEITDSGAKKIGNKYFLHTGLEGIEIHDNKVTGVFEYGDQTARVLADVNKIDEDSNSHFDTLLSGQALVWDAMHK